MVHKAVISQVLQLLWCWASWVCHLLQCGRTCYISATLKITDHLDSEFSWRICTYVVKIVIKNYQEEL